MSIDTSSLNAHPPLQGDWIDAPHHLLNIGNLPLELGGQIQNCQLSYVVHGDLKDQSKPLVVFLCAIGSIHHRLDFLINQSRTLDIKNTRIIAIDALLMRQVGQFEQQPWLATVWRRTDGDR